MSSNKIYGAFEKISTDKENQKMQKMEKWCPKD